MKKTTADKDYFQLLEYVGFNHAEVAPIAAVQAYDDVDNAAGPQSVEDPANLDRLNAYISQINDHQYINPFYALNTLWRKLQIIGLNFDLRDISFRGGQIGVSEAPLNQFGGRHGYINADGTIGNDDGISARIPGGLKLVIHWVNTNGVYTLTALIQRNQDEGGPFLETATEAVKPKSATPQDKDWQNIVNKHGYKKVGATERKTEYGPTTQNFLTGALTQGKSIGSSTKDTFEHPSGHKLTITDHPARGKHWKHLPKGADDFDAVGGREHKKLDRTLAAHQ